jgi:ATPase family associated with various cellular activities (AAA)/AAA lid domain
MLNSYGIVFAVAENGINTQRNRRDRLVAGDTHSFGDGLDVQVARLGLLPSDPPASIFDDRYPDGKTIRFEVTAANKGDEPARLSDLSVNVRCGAAGYSGHIIRAGFVELTGILLPGAMATGVYIYHVPAESAGAIDITVSWPGETPQVWTGAAARGLYGDETQRALSKQRRAKLMAEGIRELDAMIGLEPVKHRVQLLAAQARMSALRTRHRLPDPGTAHHFVFSGPPGTGKTTVARIVGKFLAGTGVLARGHLIEAHRADLIGQHLGATAIKTNALIDRALGGVLFIDEAYGLHGGYGGNSDAFCGEALQVLLKRAEDDRHRLAVILAGYPAEMSRMLAANPGLASRFPTRVNFPSYSAVELYRIASRFLEHTADVLGDDAIASLTMCCETVESKQWADVLGNGRFARTLCESARAIRDLRLAEHHRDADPGRMELTWLHAADLDRAFDEICAGMIGVLGPNRLRSKRVPASRRSRTRHPSPAASMRRC